MQNVESSNKIVVSGGDNNQQNNHPEAQEEQEEGFGPIFVNGVYSAPAHFACEKRRFERDTRIDAIVDDLGEETCNFVSVRSEKGGTVTVLTYHPNPEVELPPSLCWVEKDALYVKNAGRFYKEASNGSVIWKYKVLSGQIFDLIEREFTEDFMAGNYNNGESEKFYKKAASFIINHPHEDARKYGVYLKYFKDMITALDDKMTDVDQETLMISIANNMKRVVDFKDKNLADKKLYFHIIDLTTQLTVKQCSSNVHYKISLIDKVAESAKTDLVELSIRAEKQREADRLEKLAKVNEMKARMANVAKGKSLPAPAQKRKIEEITNAEDTPEQPPAKEQRIEQLDP